MWYYMLSDQQMGPVSRESLQQLFAQRTISADCLVWTEGMQDWQRACDVPGLLSSIPAGIGGGYRYPLPTSVKVLGILSIIFGGLGLLCTPLALVNLFIPQGAPGTEIYELPIMRVWLTVSVVVGMVMSIILLAAGIGLLNLKRWARVWALFYGWFAILWGILGTIFNIAIVIPMIQDLGPEGSPEAIGGMIGGVVGGVCGGIIGLVFPIFMVIYMRRPNVVEACNQ